MNKPECSLSIEYPDCVVTNIGCDGQQYRVTTTARGFELEHVKDNEWRIFGMDGAAIPEWLARHIEFLSAKYYPKTV